MGEKISEMEKMLAEIKKIEEKDFIHPKMPIEEGEIVLGEVGFFAKQAYTYWQRIVKELKEISQKLQTEVKPWVRKSLSERKDILVEKAVLAEQRFWFEANSDCVSWKYKSVGITKGFKMIAVPNASCNHHICTIPVSLPPEVIRAIAEEALREEKPICKDMFKMSEKEFRKRIKRDFPRNTTLPNKNKIN